MHGLMTMELQLILLWELGVGGGTDGSRGRPAGEACCPWERRSRGEGGQGGEGLNEARPAALPCLASQCRGRQGQQRRRQAAGATAVGMQAASRGRRRRERWQAGARR